MSDVWTESQDASRRRRRTHRRLDVRVRLCIEEGLDYFCVAVERRPVEGRDTSLQRGYTSNRRGRPQACTTRTTSAQRTPATRFSSDTGTTVVFDMSLSRPSGHQYLVSANICQGSGIDDNFCQPTKAPV